MAPRRKPATIRHAGNRWRPIRYKDAAQCAPAELRPSPRQDSPQKPDPDRLHDRLDLVRAPKLVAGRLQVPVGGSLGDLQDAAHLPGRLALRRPAQAFRFPRRQGRPPRAGRRGGRNRMGQSVFEDPHSCIRPGKRTPGTGSAARRPPSVPHFEPAQRFYTTCTGGTIRRTAVMRPGDPRYARHRRDGHAVPRDTPPPRHGRGAAPAGKAIAISCRIRGSAPVAQLDRVPGYEPGGRGFESCRAHHILLCLQGVALVGSPLFFVALCHSWGVVPFPGSFDTLRTPPINPLGDRRVGMHEKLPGALQTVRVAPRLGPRRTAISMDMDLLFPCRTRLTPRGQKGTSIPDVASPRQAGS